MFWCRKNFINSDVRKKYNIIIILYSFEKGNSVTDQVCTCGLGQSFNTYRLSDGSIVDCTIYDTNGTEKYRSLNESYYKKADGCLIVYDITKEESFEEIQNYYILKIKEKCKKDITGIILGNKKDLENNRKIPVEKGIQLALENNFIFKESSCVENKNVADAFQTIIEMTNINVKQRKKENNENKIIISNDNNQINNNTNNNNNRSNKKCCK